ncbi:type I-E CRISPR-associated protein Cas6/Cse3/CasE [Streptomyces nodosus]|uniref:CRISPR-associated protein n=1 Tax=Streptomyces nodosus TaxID=40318 RepID=A0A0B5DFY0_9ACTN|nr:type I-E CRISPR-associated protein Cas6/Cse3/CasE [Streptomyces nodosus]AJE40085.1 CRISPR-associated protein [Streptomyces nodosus]MBB4791086.1 CRISPR system Cascade subunit CasE [Streptomyces nodosus]QEV38664.1 type I-E CRISPR-associated protein Cas6/Cse3/CasE [Streptomyces nodosus]
MSALWLTRIVPHPASRDARRDLADAVALHRRLMSLFPDGAGDDPRATLGVLHRTDDAPTGPSVLLQSRHQPDLGRLPEHYGQAVTRTLDPLLSALRSGAHINFRCTASPVRKPGATTRALYNLPAVVPLHGAHAEQWWLRQADTAGLKVLTLHAQPLDSATGVRGKRGSGDQQRVRHARTRFDGTAVIIDSDLLRTKIAEGIGRGKAYGCGLLTIAPSHGGAV